MAIEAKEIVKSAPYAGFFPPPRPEDTKKLATFETGWYRWHDTRKNNPFGLDTGWEGYFVGVMQTPEQVAQEIGTIGAQTLKNMKMLHPYDGYVSKIWHVAQGERFDMKMLTELNTCLMARVAQLRMNIEAGRNPQGHKFRQEIQELTQNRRLQYIVEDGRVIQHTITVLNPDQQKPAVSISEALFVKTAQFSREEVEKGYEFMKLLGRSGYSLLRLAIHRQ